MSSSTTTVKHYKRGPYSGKSKSTLYRQKGKAGMPMQIEDTSRLIKRLVSFKDEIKEEFHLSGNRSKVIDNLQGLIDCFRKQIGEEENDPLVSLLNEVRELNKRITCLEEREERVSETFGELNTLIYSEHDN